jgi:hypothetical protein
MGDTLQKHDISRTMNVQQFSKEFDIGINKSYELIHTKGFPVVFIGKKALILRSQIDDWFCDNAGKVF